MLSKSPMFLSPHEEQKSPHSLRCTEGCWGERDQTEGSGKGRPAEGRCAAGLQGQGPSCPHSGSWHRACKPWGLPRGVSGHQGLRTSPFTRGAARLCSRRPDCSHDTSGSSLTSTDLWLHDYSKTRLKSRRSPASPTSQGIRVTTACSACV